MSTVKLTILDKILTMGQTLCYILWYGLDGAENHIDKLMKKEKLREKKLLEQAKRFKCSLN